MNVFAELLAELLVNSGTSCQDEAIVFIENDIAHIPPRITGRACSSVMAVPGPHDYFDERLASRYDEKWAELFDPAVVDPAVDFLVEKARDGWALELGVGTGRIAIPLAARGVPVHGIELSRAMAARLRAKPGGEAVGVTIGDFATATVEGSFSLAYLVRNTIMNLTNQPRR